MFIFKIFKQNGFTNCRPNYILNNPEIKTELDRDLQYELVKMNITEIFQAIILFVTFLISLYQRLPLTVINKEYCSARIIEEETDESLNKAKMKMNQLTGKSVPDFMQQSYFEMVNKNNRRTHTDMLRFESVSIIYADVVGFTKLSTILPTKDLFEALNDLFSSFDELARKYKLLRVRILGDAYYAVCGLPSPLSIPYPRHASHTVLMGIEMAKKMVEFRERAKFNNSISESKIHGVDYETQISMRIGINSGTVMCGLFGKTKLQFDIFGSDVTIAEHLESSGRKLQIHISEDAKECIEEDNLCSALSNIPMIENTQRDDKFLDEQEITSYLINPLCISESLENFIKDPDERKFNGNRFHRDLRTPPPLEGV